MTGWAKSPLGSCANFDLFYYPITAGSLEVEICILIHMKQLKIDTTLRVWQPFKYENTHVKHIIEIRAKPVTIICLST